MNKDIIALIVLAGVVAVVAANAKSSQVISSVFGGSAGLFGTILGPVGGQVPQGAFSGGGLG